MGKWTRRAFIAAGSLAGGGLLLGVGGFALAPNRLKIGRLRDQDHRGLNTWVALDTQGGIRVVVPHAELGQGTHTALAMMLVDEMDGDWNQVTVAEAPATAEFANGALAYVYLPLKGRVRAMQRGYDYLSYRAARYFGLQPTGGSTSVRGTGQHAMRIAGAAARDMLLRAAAKRWKVDADSCTTQSSRVLHAASGRSVAFGELAAEAAALDPPTTPSLKSPDRFTLIGTPIRRVEIPSKVDGSARFGIDARPPGLLYAAVRRAPVSGASLASCESSSAAKASGVRRVLQQPDAVAVIADSTFHAMQALERVQCTWSTDAVRDALSSDSLRTAQLRALENGPLAPVVVHDGADAALAAVGATRIEARYEVPFLAHATMEPMSATARFVDGRLDIWTAVQDPLHSVKVAAKELGIERSAVTVHHALVGGGFGRRLPGYHDYVLQAVRIAREMSPDPVKLTWSRSEDLTQGYYRPATIAELAATLGKGGLPLAWRCHCSDDSLGEAGQPLYSVPKLALLAAQTPHHVRTGPWRSVGHSQQGFFVESFIDELARAAGADPYRYRLQLLSGNPRARAVLERVANMAGWDQPLPADQARGIALVRSFESYVAEVVHLEVQRDEQGRPVGLRVLRVHAAVDCGIVVNPLSAEAQIQGGIVMGLSAALGEAISLRNGAVQETNFHQYPLLRMPDAPPVDVAFLPSAERPGGLGEPGVPPLAPALVNAWFAATGQRIRRLPMLAEIQRNGVVAAG